MVEQQIKGAGGGELSGAEWLALNTQNRAIAIDYAMKPKVRNVRTSAGGERLAAYFDRHAANFATLSGLIAELHPFFKAIPADADPAELTPFWNNGWFPPLDAMVLCMLIYANRPRRYVEVGSGNSTKFVRHAIRELGLDTKIISIDPYPRADIDRLCDEVVRQPLEDLDVAFFDDLDTNDILFIDSSHRSFQNSDVTVFFLEILPALQPGMIYGIHDIFLPFDYPESFVPRFYSEQYLLATYLLGGMRDEVVFPCYHVAHHPEHHRPWRAFGDDLGLGEGVLNGGAFWARKGSEIRGVGDIDLPAR